MKLWSHLEMHAWWGQRKALLKKAERAECDQFLEKCCLLSNDEFVLALNRWMMGREAKPKNWSLMLDLLQACATMERELLTQHVPK